MLIWKQRTPRKLRLKYSINITDLVLYTARSFFEFLFGNCEFNPELPLKLTTGPRR